MKKTKIQVGKVTAKMNAKEIFINIISPVLGALLVAFIGVIFGGQMAMFGLIIVILLWILAYRFTFVAPKQKKKQFQQFFIKEYFSPSYGQAKEIGIFFQNTNKEQEDVFPKIRIIGEIKQEEYENGNWKEAHSLLPTADNRVYPDCGKIEFNIPKNIILVRIDKKNILIPLIQNFLLGSFWEIEQENYEFVRKRWSFSFEIFGKEGNEQKKFDTELYSFSFEAYERDQDVFLKFGEVKRIS
jgi:hypothetical protein